MWFAGCEKQAKIMPNFNARQLLAPLGAREREILLRELLAENAVPGSHVAASLKACEDWFYRRVENAATPRQAMARARLWFIFMLLRHGGLRPAEALRLSCDGADFNAGILRIGGSHARIVPLPLWAAKSMALMWSRLPFAFCGPSPFACHASQVRRAMKQCADALKLPSSAISASALRLARGQELAASGLHPQLVEICLGRGVVRPLFAKEDAFNLIKRHIQREKFMKTSARNVFHGHVAQIKDSGILVEVTVATPEGLNIHSIITSASCKSLDLCDGKAITAMVKAPWVSVYPQNSRAVLGADNCFQGRVKSVSRDDLACEIIIALPQGNELCALYANGASPDADIQADGAVQAGFSAFSVILLEA